MLTKKNFLYIKITLPKINWLRISIPLPVVNLILNDAIDLLGFINWISRLKVLDSYVKYLYAALEVLKEFRNYNESEIVDINLGKENIGIKVKLV